MLDLPFDGTLLNAAGTLGFAPNPRKYGGESLGAFITNPISRRPRTPANSPRLVSFPGGHLVHSGHPNPGFSKVVKKYASRWKRAGLPVIVHLLAETPDDIYSMVRRLEEVEGVGGVELGMGPGSHPNDVHAAVQAAIGELPVILKLGLEQVVELAGEVKAAGASAIAFGPPRGTLVGPAGRPVNGRILGPCVFPLAFDKLLQMPSGLDVIFSGGLMDAEAIGSVLENGAAAVQLDMLFWKRQKAGLSVPSEWSSAHH